MTLPALCLAFVAGYLVGRRGQRKLDALLWWNAGWNAAMDCGRNPLKKRTSFATIEELTQGKR